MNVELIPALDAAGLPGPPWLFHFLLVFTFFLHLIFMNLTLGGTLMAFVANLKGGGRANDANTVFATRLMGVNTYAISLAITTGVAPLLFVQVLYQQYFYAGTILLGWIWFAMLVFLMIGYYAAYLHKKFRGGWLGLSAVMFFAIAMVHVAVHLVHVQPAKWRAFDVSAISVLGDPTYWPRLLHFVLAAVTFAALVAAWWAVRRARAGIDVELNTTIAASAWRWALWATVLQIVDGFLLTIVLPTPVLLGIMRGGLATLGPLTLGILLGIGLLAMLARGSNPVDKPGLVSGTLATLLLTVAIMSITRHQVRVLYLDEFTSQFSATIVPQWGNFVLFAVLLVAGLATVFWMIRRVLTSPAEGEDAA
ncbi:MAG: hypothetical protein V2I67_04500 [Thermoanaerobaculales bacterium]|jgi:hypothetical protein|nr:hypothetical protein [Thermoanaerobaculales bacterium]